MSHRLRFTPRVAALASLLAALAVLASGCASQEAIARARLVAQAEPICERIAADRLAVNAALANLRGSTSKQLQLLTRVAPTIAADEHHAVDRLRTLKAPAPLAREWQQMLAGMQQLADDDTQIGRYARARNFKGMQSIIAGGDQLRRRLSAIARVDGFTYCGHTS
jgi:hypothetical protein